MQNEIVEFDKIETGLLPPATTEEMLVQLKDECFALEVKGFEDAEGYKACKEMRSRVRKLRIDIENRRKERKAGALEFGRRLDTEAKRITAIVVEGEQHLIAQQNIIDDEKKRIAEEQERKKKEMVEARLLLLQRYQIECPLSAVEVMSDTDFEELVAKGKEKFEQEEARKKAEAERIAQLEKEKEAAEKKAAEKEAAEQKLKDELIEKQRKEIEEQKAEALEKERKEQQRIAQEESQRREKEREAREKEEAEQAAKEEAERKAAEKVANEKMFAKIKEDFPTVEEAWVEIARLYKLLDINMEIYDDE